jgi:hypothetical protein
MKTKNSKRAQTSAADQSRLLLVGQTRSRADAPGPPEQTKKQLSSVGLKAPGTP